jgi:hypothetical protein
MNTLHECRAPERESMTRSTSNSAHALRLPEPRSEFPGSARALACCVPRPRGIPERTNNFHTPEFSNASSRPARARVGTHEGACAPRWGKGIATVPPTGSGALTLPARIDFRTRWNVFGGTPKTAGETPAIPNALRKARRCFDTFNSFTLRN